jgi:hypothetical protein
MGTEVSDDEIGRRLYEAARSYAEQKGYHFGPGADVMIEGFAHEAVGKIEARAAESGRPRETLVKQSQDAFYKLIDVMIRAADEIEGYSIDHPHAIGEQTLGAAMNRLCPLWPIC